MITILYTDSDAVRSALGVESFSDQNLQRELPDTMFSSQDFARQLRAALYSWVPTHADIIAAGDAPGTDEEVHYADLVRNYSLYWCAWRAAMMAYATRRNVGDGKSELQRFEVDWLKLAEEMKKLFEDAQDELMEALNPATTIAFAKRVEPDYDPVTNT